MIKAGQTEVRVETSAVNDQSKIFVSAYGDGDDVPVVSISEKGNGYFVIKLNEIEQYNVSVDWWVVEGIE